MNVARLRGIKFYKSPDGEWQPKINKRYLFDALLDVATALKYWSVGQYNLACAYKPDEVEKRLKALK